MKRKHLAALVSSIALFAVPANAGATVLLGNNSTSGNSPQAFNNGDTFQGISDTASAFPYTSSSSGTATAFSAYFAAGGDPNPLELGVYSDNGSGRPGQLLGYAYFAANQTVGWHKATAAAGFSIQARTVYWLAVLIEGNNLTFDYLLGRTTGCNTSNEEVYAPISGWTALPSSWPGGDTPLARCNM